MNHRTNNWCCQLIFQISLFVLYNGPPERATKKILCMGNQHDLVMSSNAPNVQNMDAVDVEMPHGNLVKHVIDNTKYNDPDFVAASIIAARYDDPHVPQEITSILSGGGGMV